MIWIDFIIGRFFALKIFIARRYSTLLQFTHYITTHGTYVTYGIYSLVNGFNIIVVVVIIGVMCEACKGGVWIFSGCVTFCITLWCVCVAITTTYLS